MHLLTRTALLSIGLLLVAPPLPLRVPAGQVKAAGLNLPALQTAPGRAAVLEPFAVQLNLGPTAGQPEIDPLNQAGFKVDVFRNGDVTVPVMQTLGNYSFVYIQTHSGPLSGGDAGIVTDETDDKPYRDLEGECGPDHDDCSVKQMTVAGDDRLYVAVTGYFFSHHAGTFPNSAIVFLNGCSILQARLFWKDLQAKNVAALISWDEEVDSAVSEVAGAIVIQDLAKGDTVAQSVQDAINRGAGESVVQKSDGSQSIAQLGFLGDGTDTLARALAGDPAPTLTPTPRPTPKPKPTARPAKKSKCKPGHHRVHGKCKLCPKHHCKKTKKK